jgi:hypothetical protein
MVPLVELEILVLVSVVVRDYKCMRIVLGRRCGLPNNLIYGVRQYANIKVFLL